MYGFVYKSNLQFTFNKNLELPMGQDKLFIDHSVSYSENKYDYKGRSGGIETRHH